MKFKDIKIGHRLLLRDGRIVTVMAFQFHVNSLICQQDTLPMDLAPFRIDVECVEEEIRFVDVVRIIDAKDEAHARLAEHFPHVEDFFQEIDSAPMHGHGKNGEVDSVMFTEDLMKVFKLPFNEPTVKLRMIDLITCYHTGNGPNYQW